jgi:hypothetical protein
VVQQALFWRHKSLYQTQGVDGVQMAHGHLPVEGTEAVCEVIVHAECVLRVEKVDTF